MPFTQNNINSERHSSNMFTGWWENYFLQARCYSLVIYNLCQVRAVFDQEIQQTR